MANQYANKIIYGGETLIDLTNDTVAADKLLSGYKAHDKTGAIITGTCTFDVDSSVATAQDAEVLTGKTFGANGEIKTGTMPNRGAIAGTIATKDQVYTVPNGYHDGSGTVQLDSTEKAKLIAENIREGIIILGVEGSMSGTEDAHPQAKDVTPSTAEQVILPDEGYNYLSQVTVAAIPYVETDNAAGGKTVTIG